MMKKYTYPIIIFLIVVTFLPFGRILDNAFINYDDPAYIINNLNIKSGLTYESIKWAFTSSSFYYWQPLSWLTHILAWNIFGANAGGHHLMSLLLHIGAVIFLFLFLNKTTNNIWPSAFAAAFFALHPLRVESVAWAAERKDVLSMFFGMACLYAYALYVQNFKVSRYMLCLILFAAALMSKPMMVTLPFVLMLLDFWPLYRWKRALYEQGRGGRSAGGLILEKVPFIVLTVISSLLTFQEQNHFKSLATLDMLPVIPRVSNVIVSYAAYLGKILWPFNLAAFYPYDFSIVLWKVVISGVFIAVITIVALYKINKYPFLFAGWFWYLITFIPLSGLIQSGMQAMADRHTYLPFIGIAIMLSWGVPYLFAGRDARKKILLPAGTVFIVVLSVLSWQQCGYWKNSIELWSHALQVTKNNYVAYNLLGVALSAKEKQEEAVYYYDKAISIAPLYAFAYNNRGVAYVKLGRPEQSALNDFTRAIELRPDYADAYNNRAIIYFKQNNIQNGCPDAQKACSLGICTALKSAENRGYFCR